MTAKSHRNLSGFSLEKTVIAKQLNWSYQTKKTKIQTLKSLPNQQRSGKKIITHFQDIFKAQNISKDNVKIKKFQLTDNDPAPYEELLRRQIQDELKDKIEGLLIELELEESLFNNMKPNSAPGIDGFTIKFLRTFWPILAPLITNAINFMKKRGSYP